MTDIQKRLDGVTVIEDDTDARKFTEAVLIEFIQRTFQWPEYATFDHVRSAVGHEHSVRTADAMAFGMWPSRGLYLTGFEIKCARQDWLNELKNPAKADEIGRYCDFWYIVAPKGVVKLDELPENWGWMVPQRTKLKMKKKAVQNMDPEPLTRKFIASFIRKVFGRRYSDDELDHARNRGIEEGRRRMKNELLGDDPLARQWERKHNDLERNIKRFEEASGVDLIDAWNGQRIGYIVKFLIDNGYTIEREMDDLRRAAKNLTKLVKEYGDTFNIEKR